MSSPNIEQTEGSGPDGSSIVSYPQQRERPHILIPCRHHQRPVSSLLARFENMNKTGPSQPQPASAPAAAPVPPQSRNASPGPKPERLKSLKPAQEIPTAPAKPSNLKDRAVATASPANRDRGPPAPPPPLSTRPPPAVTKPPVPIHPPAVTVQPPQSPPKPALNSLSGEQSPFLDPVTVSSATSSRSPTPLRISSRPLSPTGSGGGGGGSGTATPRSPKQGSSKAPSPPPPRRSGELKREKEWKPAPPPPPAPRSERTLMRANTVMETRGRPATKKANRSQESSPFNGDARNPEPRFGDNPPELPMRPRPQQQSDAPSRTKQLAGAFEQPATAPRPSMSVRKPAREGEVNGIARAPITPQLTGDARPALPARPQTTDIPPQPPANNGIRPPPKPPRPAGPSSTQTIAPSSVSQPQPPASNPNRVVSNPLAQQAPQKAQARTKTMDIGVAEHAVSDARTSSVPAAAPVVKQAPAPTTNEGIVARSEPPNQITTYPDSSSINRRPPYIKKGCYDIQP